MAGRRSSGEAFSSRIVAAPTRSGNSTRPPTPNVNAIGGEPMKRSWDVGRSTCLPKRVADREHVAVEMHGALRHAGGARGEGDQADIVARGVAGREVLVARFVHQGFEAVGDAEPQ